LKHFNRVLGNLTGAIIMSAGAHRRSLSIFRKGLKNSFLNEWRVQISPN
jgi:hypothetical protein